MLGEVFETKGYGLCEVIAYKNAHNVTVRFLDTGYETTSQKYNIKVGAVKDKKAPSVLGVGITGHLPVRINGVIVPEYKLWRSIIQRCYDPAYHKLQPSYIGCTVSENFKHYEFFHEWCKNQIGFGNKGWHLDKDLLSDGSRSYHEDHCVFVPLEINLVLNYNSKSRGKYLLGVHLDVAGQFRATINRWGKQYTLGGFHTEEEAFNAYKEAKEVYIKEVAIFFKDHIDIRVYEYLINYKLEVM